MATSTQIATESAAALKRHSLPKPQLSGAPVVTKYADIDTSRTLSAQDKSTK